MHMSKYALYDQLTSEYGEKFTQQDAQYAIDNLVITSKNHTTSPTTNIVGTINNPYPK